MALSKKHPLNWHTFFLCVVISFGQFVGAYEAVIIGTTLGKQDFMVRMSLWDSNGKNTPNFAALEGAIVGLFQAGAIFGPIVAAFLMDRWGRKAGLIVGAPISLAAMAGLTGSMNVTEFLIFRFLAGLGTWICGAAASAYIPELAPPAYRGFFAGLNGIMIGLGVSIGSYVGMGFYFSTDPVAQWRAPLGIPMFGPILLLCAIPFLPESPRYLLLKDKPEEARRIFNKLNAGTDASLIDEEFNQMQQQAAYDRTLDSSWVCLLTNPVYRKRVYLGFCLTFLGQSTGVFVINNYGQTFYQALGFSPASRQIIQGNRDIVALVGNIVGSCIVDRVGRRLILLVAFTGCFLCVLLEAIVVALYAQSDNVAGKNAGVALLYIFLAFFACGIDAGTYVYLGEMFPNHVRVKGIGIALASLNIAATIYLSVAGIAFAAIGWKFFLVFAAITFCSIIWIYVSLPETRRLPLEEIEALFGNIKDTVLVISPAGHRLEAELTGEETGASQHSSDDKGFSNHLEN